MKVTLSRRIFLFLNGLFMIFMVLVCLLPFLHVLFASVSSPSFIAQNKGLILFPREFTLRGYELVLRNQSISTGYFNTIFLTVVGTLISLIVSALAAYTLSRKGLMLHKVFMRLMVIAMFFSGGLIPFYLIVDAVGLRGSRWSMIIPYLASSWNIIIMRTSFMQIPDSLEESAKIDGANDLTVLFRIVLPLSTAVLAVMTLFYAIGYWNSWFPAVLFITDRSKFPLQLILREILIQNDTAKIIKAADMQRADQALFRQLVKYCTIVVASLPIVIIYPFLQKYFVSGMMIGSIKE